MQFAFGDPMFPAESRVVANFSADGICATFAAMP
jgi:hypothetical protein